MYGGSLNGTKAVDDMAAADGRKEAIDARTDGSQRVSVTW
jgi:hypothetical protein